MSNEPVTKDDLESAKIEVLSAIAQSQVAIVATVQDSMEAVREQNSNEHSRMHRILEWIQDHTDRLFRRFGFLVDRHQVEPPAPPNPRPPAPEQPK